MELTQLSALDWGFVALVVIPLLQMPLVLYLSRYAETDGEAPVGHAVEFRVDPDESPHDSGRDTERVRTSRSEDARVDDPATDPSSVAPPSTTCSACGTENDPDFSYCRRCVTELSDTRSAVASIPPQ